VRTPEWWADEVALVAERTGLDERALAAVLPASGTLDEARQEAWSAPPVPRDLARLFHGAASALRRAAATGDEAGARAQLVSLVVVGELVGAPSAAWWAMAHAESESLADRLPRLAETLSAAGDAIADETVIDPGQIDLDAIEREIGDDAEEDSAMSPVEPPMPAVATRIERQREAPAPRRELRRSAGRTRALIADDSAIAARFLERQLAARGIDVVYASDAHDARAALEGGGFDVVFWDCDLPGFDGDALLASHPEWAERAVLLADAGGSRPRGAAVRTIARPPAEEELDALSILPPRRAGARADAG
jgi:CheY-like chemotaxis protein